MNKTVSRILLLIAALVFVFGLYLISREPDGDGRRYAPILPIGSVVTILIIIASRRRRRRKEIS